MSNQNDHPTVKRYHERTASNAVHPTIPRLSAPDLRKMCLECGADDVGIVEIARPALAGEKEDFSLYSPGRSRLSVLQDGSANENAWVATAQWNKLW